MHGDAWRVRVGLPACMEQRSIHADAFVRDACFSTSSRKSVAACHLAPAMQNSLWVHCVVVLCRPNQADPLHKLRLHIVPEFTRRGYGASLIDVPSSRHRSFLNRGYLAVLFTTEPDLVISRPSEISEQKIAVVLCVKCKMFSTDRSCMGISWGFGQLGGGTFTVHTST